MNQKKSGLVLLHKPIGLTSFQVLKSIKQAVGHGKVGHAGTLDKFAEGVLIVAVGSYTRLLSLFEGLDKVYEGRIRFGLRTDTLDPEGDIVEKAEVPSLDTIKRALPQFEGSIEQTPPQYSAVHVDGKRAYQRVRAGEQPQLKSRNVHIYKIDIKEWNSPDLDLNVHCSKGTYIRSIARDVGIACNSAAYLTSLVRTRIGDFSLDETVSPEYFSAESDLLPAEKIITRLPGLEVIQVDPEKIPLIRNGVPFREEWIKEWRRDKTGATLLAVIQPNEGFLALVENKTGSWKYRMVMEGG